jgi:chromosome segregation ATPase
MMDYEGLMTLATNSSAPILASVATFTVNKLWQAQAARKNRSISLDVAEQRSLYEKQKNLTEEVNVLLSANKSYREEIKKDLDLLKNELEESTCFHRKEMEMMKKEYEEEIQRLRTKISELASELLTYRRENGALHLLLSEKGIEVPSWVKKSTDK